MTLEKLSKRSASIRSISLALLFMLKIFEKCFKKQKSHFILKYKTNLNKLTKLKKIAKKKKYYQKELQLHKDNVSKQ